MTSRQPDDMRAFDEKMLAWKRQRIERKIETRRNWPTDERAYRLAVQIHATFQSAADFLRQLDDDGAITEFRPDLREALLTMAATLDGYVEEIDKEVERTKRRGQGKAAAGSDG